MDERFNAVFNGQEWSSRELGILMGETWLETHEPSASVFAIIRFFGDMQCRGWGGARGQLHKRDASDENLMRVQATVRRILSLAASLTSREFTSAGDLLREELLDALDGILISSAVPSVRTRAFDRHRKLISNLEEFARANLHRPLYSEALAKELGTSNTVLKLAIREVQGVSLHHYLRNKRLWSLRTQLTNGLPGATVSSAAVANGFLHMGELSGLYKRIFGESPSETLQRSRGT